MSEVAIRNTTAVDIQPAQDQAIARLADWAQAADAAYTMASKLVATQFVPQQYRGKPAEATAAILAGAEVGLSPMAALRAFDNIQGTPAPKAITLRAIVQSIGHDIRVVESCPTRAVVTGLRAGESEENRQTSVWTIERAEQAGYVSKNPNYKSKPAEMLVARATSEVCRWVASDAIMGMPYSAEEIRDEGPQFDARTAPPRVTAAEILGVQEVTAAPDEPEVVEPGDVVDVDDTVVDERRPMSREQQTRMTELFGEVDMPRGDRLTYVNEVLAEVYGPDRQVSSSSELGGDEADAVIGKLQRWADDIQPTEVEVAEVVGGQR